MNRSQLKAQHQELNNSQPFTEKEQQRFNKKELTMIRNIQILNNIDKKAALKVIKAYKTSPKQTLKVLAKEYRKRLDKISSPNAPEIRGEIPPHGKKQGKRTGDVLRNNRKLTNAYLKNPKNRNTTNYNKIEKASKRYIDASPYELRYGVNSKKSQAYRERNGLSQKYAGRTIK